MSREIQKNKAQRTRKTRESNFHESKGTFQEATRDDSENKTSSIVQHNEYRCPICWDTLKNTRITKECYHRFCKDCIVTALRVGNKECPVCRRKVVSKRSLNPDPQFDELISKTFSRGNDEEASHKKALSKRKRSKNLQARSCSNENDHEVEAINRPQQGEKQQTKVGTRAMGHCEVSHHSNTSTTHSWQEAGPSNKRTKRSPGRRHVSKCARMTTNSVTDYACETESSCHPSHRKI